MNQTYKDKIRWGSEGQNEGIQRPNDKIRGIRLQYGDVNFKLVEMRSLRIPLN